MLRAVIYLGVGDQEDQLTKMYAYCAAKGYEVVAVVTGDKPMSAARAMIRDGQADVLVIASRRNLPVRIEIITQEIQVPPQHGDRRPHRLK